ncbi:Hypothetical protein PACV_387 [Pacmanvirus A23]|uniref:Hypothetical protein n=1 Tax=Pacmanvirus A23 TaxID=1932881 RepID=UPI000A094C51|nr:Hypothetical protein B9W72_gp383 [Pacmanvirus A23]SIP86100.1 Hypothetical protein PACV_387 [Pacmanvirus A23]
MEAPIEDHIQPIYSTSGQALLSQIALNRGTIIQPEDICVDDILPDTSELHIMCMYKHTWKTIVGNIGEWCAICKIQLQLRKYDPTITCLQSNYTVGQNRFMFKCRFGHKFLCDDKSTKNGCKYCYVLSLARRKHGAGTQLNVDIKCVYFHEDSRLRFHCNKLKHNPFCKNPECVEIASGGRISDREYAANCSNFTPCNQDFYATPQQVKYDKNIYCCKNNHRWGPKKEVITSVRIFEIIFNERFDDDTHFAGVEFTGYNKALHIAFTHGLDKIPSKCLRNAERWCNSEKINFIYVPAEITKTSHICTKITTQICDMGLITDVTQLSLTKRVRTKMHIMDKNHRLFTDKCVYVE